MSRGARKKYTIKYIMNSVNKDRGCDPLEREGEKSGARPGDPRVLINGRGLLGQSNLYGQYINGYLLRAAEKKSATESNAEERENEKEKKAIRNKKNEKLKSSLDRNER